MQVVILAGGLGTRLRPLTNKIPKVMIPIKEKPFLEYILELLKKNNLEDVLLCIGYSGDQIKSYFEDGKKIGMNISYSFEKELLGTGGALKNAQRILEKEFIVINGDTFLDIDFQDIISYFHKQQKLATMVVFQNQPKIMRNNIEINNKNEVINYNKEKEEKTNYVDAGVQVFKKDILKLIPSNKNVSLEEEIFPILIQKKEMLAYSTNQRFYDIGTFEQLKQFNNQII